MMTIGRSLPALAALALLAGCSTTHTHVLAGFDADPARLRNSRAKKAAVVFLEPDLKSRYESATEGHAFVFEDARGFYRQAYASALKDSVASVEFLTEEPASGYDYYLYPRLDLAVKTTLVTKSCQADYALTVKDGAKRVKAARSKRGKRDFQVIANADEACRIAMLQAFDEVTYGALREADASVGLLR